jgi:ATP-dependent exoDNAse (exonuclease V) alpha subunit
MGHGPATFKETDLIRVLRAVRKAGADVERVEIGRDGRIVLVLKNGDEVSPESNEWDEVDGAD